MQVIHVTTAAKAPVKSFMLVCLAQEDPEWTAEKELCTRRGVPYVAPTHKEVEDEEHQSAEASALPVGSRCEVNPGGKRGCIR